MKVCSLCQREFEDQQQFCTRDGTKLTRIQERGYCRRCGKDYPLALNKCPLHGTVLAEHGPRTILGDNFCHLCDSDFPKAFKLCPVHGIALQTSPLKKKLRNQIEQSENRAVPQSSALVIEDQDNPPDTNPLPRLSAAKKEQEWTTGDLPRTDALVASGPLSEALVEPIANPTRELDRAVLVNNPIDDEVPTPKTDQIQQTKQNVKSLRLENNAAPKRSPFDSLKKVNRKYIASTAIVLLALLVSVGAYNVYVKRSAEESIRFSEPGAQNKTGNAQTKKADTNNSTDQTKVANKPAQTTDPAVAATTVSTVANAQKGNTPAVPATNDPKKAQSKQTAKPDGPDPDETTPSDKTRPIFIPKAQDPPPAEPPHKDEPKPPVKDKKPEIRETQEQVTPSRPDTARVVASVRNRRRVAIPGGFHYSFEVVLTEINGIGVNWENGIIERTSENGFTTSKTAGYDFALAAHGHTQIRVEVDMIGSTTRDWKGTALYSNKGTDDNGHVVRVKYRIPLDESFRD